MDFKEVVEKRYSIRQFQSTPVPTGLVKKLIELSKLAPSAGNLQSYRVIITKQKMGNVEAPLYLVLCADLEKSAARYGDRGRNLFSIQDATIFGAYLQLAIVNCGLASTWVGAFNEGEIKNLLKLPENLKPIAIIALGYPVGEKSGRRRRSFKDIIY
jgi:nitroreductase